MHGADIPSDEQVAVLRLARSERIGPVTFHQLLARFGSARAALEALPALAAKATGARPPRIATDAQVKREAAALARAGGRFLLWGDADYPAALAAIPDAPPALAVRGEMALLRRPIVAVVGARDASANGRKLAADLAEELGLRGYVVVSGLARGVDAAAHRGSLASGTVAVLAGGLDHVYPQENAALHEAIAGQGLLVSECALGTAPTERHFPRRNRLVSGLSLGVVVIEAALRSGSLITAHRALDQGREVFAVPGSPLDPRCRGSNDLLRQGAHLVETVDDVLAHLPRHDRPPPQVQKDFNKVSYPVEKPDGRIRPSDRSRILACLSPAPTAVDEIVRQCQVSPAVVAAALLELELAGRLERHPGQAVSLIP